MDHIMVQARERIAGPTTTVPVNAAPKAGSRSRVMVARRPTQDHEKLLPANLRR
jgi:hypothetical protein